MRTQDADSIWNPLSPQQSVDVSSTKNSRNPSRTSYTPVLPENVERQLSFTLKVKTASQSEDERQVHRSISDTLADQGKKAKPRSHDINGAYKDDSGLKEKDETCIEDRTSLKCVPLETADGVFRVKNKKSKMCVVL